MKTRITIRPRIARAVCCAAVWLGLATSSLHGQDLGIKAPAQSMPVVIVNATIHPVGAAPIEKGYIFFDGGTIKKIGAMDESPVFIGTTVSIDAKGKHVYPGLISAYSQLGLVEIAAVRASRDTSEVGGVTPEARAIIAVNPDSTFLPVTRKNGILLSATFPQGGVIAGRAGVMRMDGWTWEEMAITQEAGLFVQWPMMRVVNLWWTTTSEAEQRKNIAKATSAIREAFTLARAYASRRDADATTPIDVRWEAMRPVFGTAGKPAAMPTFVFATDYDQIVAASELAREFGLRLIIVGGHEALMAADLLKRDRTPVILTCVMDVPRRDDSPYDEFFSLPAKLKAAGVTFCISSGDKTAHERNLPYAAAMAAAHGLDRDAALRSITTDAAAILGISDRYGALQEGLSATLIVTTGDPLLVETNVELAFIDGRRIDLNSKQDDLAKKYREKYRQMDADGKAKPKPAP